MAVGTCCGGLGTPQAVVGRLNDHCDHGLTAGVSSTIWVEMMSHFLDMSCALLSSRLWPSAFAMAPGGPGLQFPGSGTLKKYTTYHVPHL